MHRIITTIIFFGLSGGAYAADSFRQLNSAAGPGGAGHEFYQSISLGSNSEAPVFPTPGFGVPGCFVSANGGLVNANIMNACVLGSKILLDRPPSVSSPQDIVKGNLKEAADASLSGSVSCEFVPMTSEEWSTTGYSEKFRCYHINPDASKGGKYFNSKGELVPEAVSVGANGTPVAGLLLDAGGQTISGSSGKPYKAERLKVKYFLGNARMREPFTETASTRLFWALGIPADHVFFPGQIICHGCAANPFQAKQAAAVPGSQTFQWASIEKNLDGEAIAKRADKGWEWDALRQAALASGQMPQFDTLFLASRLIAMSNPKPLQNKTRCVSADKKTGQCNQVYSYVSDVGSSFGRAGLFESPRGELKGYLKQSVFADKRTCTLDDSYLGHVVSEGGRGLMVQRLLAAFGDASSGSIDTRKVRAIFEAAHFEGLDLNPSDNGELDAWTGKLAGLMKEILSARCQANPPLSTGKSNTLQSSQN